MSKLPAEILYTIFKPLREHDDQHSLRACSLVCTNWTQPSQQLLYLKCIIRKKDGMHYFLKSIKNNETLANVVKEIKLVGASYYGTVRDEIAFADLFNYLPNLEILSNDKKIKDALTECKLPRLKVIDALPILEEDYHDYATCILPMKQQIESLTIAD